MTLTKVLDNYETWAAGADKWAPADFSHYSMIRALKVAVKQLGANPALNHVALKQITTILDCDDL